MSRKTTLPHPLSISECSKLLSACNRADLYALVDFLWAAGCRISEALALRWCDIDWEQRQAIVRGKGGRERVVLFHKEAAESLKTWQRAQQERNTALGQSWGPTGAIWPRSRQALDQALRAAAKRANIEGVHFHALRHAFSTQCHSNGMNIRVLMELLGHAKLSSTQIYTHVSDSEMMAQGQVVADALSTARGHGLTQEALRRTTRGLRWR